MKCLLFVAAASLCAFGQTLVDLHTQARNVDFSSAISTRPVKTGTILPAICFAGELYFKSDTAPGSNLYGCVAKDTWAQMTGGVSGGSGTYSAGLGVVLAGSTFGADFGSIAGLATPNTYSNMNDFSLGQIRRFRQVQARLRQQPARAPPMWANCTRERMRRLQRQRGTAAVRPG